MFYTKNVAYHPWHPLEKAEPETWTFDMPWHGFCREVGSVTHPIWRLGARKRLAPDFCQDSHVCDLGELWNTGRRKAPRIRRALCAPEHARACPASRQRPAGALARARAYKARSGVDCTLPRTLKPHRISVHRRLPVRDVSAATRATAAVDRPTQLSPTPSNPRRRVCTTQ
jgi:hypothetical protein